MTRAEWDELWTAAATLKATLPPARVLLIPAQRDRVTAQDDLAG